MLARLQRLIAEHLSTLVALYQAAGKTFPLVFRRELELFFTCGERAYGSAMAGCSACGHVRVIHFSCKRRSLCWRCIARRRDECVPHVMRTLPRTDMRHWVLTMPMELRIHLRRYPPLLSKVRRSFVRAIRHHLRMRAKRYLGLKTVRFAHSGAISVTHLTSANLARNVHFHAIVPDGVFIEDPVTGEITFYTLSAPTSDDLTKVAWQVCKQTCALLRRYQRWTDSPEPVERGTIRGTIALGRPRDVTFTAACTLARAPQVSNAFQAWASDSIHRLNRAGLKNLVLYLLSPAVTERQLSILPGDRVRFRFKRPRWDGTASETFAAHEFIRALTGLIHHPRAHALEYHGVLGRNSKIQERVAPSWTSTSQPPQVHHDRESLEYRAARVILSRRAHRSMDRCAVCFHAVTLLALATHNFRYTNPRWRPPDTPDLPTAHPPPRTATRGAN